MAFIQNERQVFTENRAGLIPKHVNISETYNISTENAGMFITNKIVEMANRLSEPVSDKDSKAIKELKNSLDKEDIEFARNFDPHYISFGKENNFIPIMISMPSEVGVKHHFNNNENSIFNVENKDNIKINPIVYTVLRMYMYKTPEVNAICSHEGNRIYHLSPSSQHHLRKYSKLKTITINRNKDKYITVCLDPIKVFHDMLSDPNPDNNCKGFKVTISRANIKKISGQNYNYHVNKIPNNGKNKKKIRKENKDIDNELCEALRRS